MTGLVGAIESPPAVSSLRCCLESCASLGYPGRVSALLALTSLALGMVNGCVFLRRAGCSDLNQRFRQMAKLLSRLLLYPGGKRL